MRVYVGDVRGGRRNDRSQAATRNTSERSRLTYTVEPTDKGVNPERWRARPGPEARVRTIESGSTTRQDATQEIEWEPVTQITDPSER